MGPAGPEEEIGRLKTILQQREQVMNELNKKATEQQTVIDGLLEQQRKEQEEENEMRPLRQAAGDEAKVIKERIDKLTNDR